MYARYLQVVSMGDLSHLFQSTHRTSNTRLDQIQEGQWARQVHDKRTNHSNYCVAGIYIIINRVHGEADSLQSPEDKHS